MIAALTALVVAASPSAACSDCTLSSRAAPRVARTQTLLAQAELPPPPLPSEETQPLLPAAPSGASASLQLRIDELNREIRGIDVNWPSHLIVIAYIGYVVAPSGIIMGGMVTLIGIVLLTAGPAALPVLAVGGGILLIGLAGVAAIVFAWVNGNAVQEDARRRRNELIRERDALEAQRKSLTVLRDRPVPMLVTVWTF